MLWSFATPKIAARRPCHHPGSHSVFAISDIVEPEKRRGG
jgi:hypothetical protein